jgi:predicted 3-demethylubiquinone-9 3-methyltransferase (glyoxalase superfamily)
MSIERVTPFLWFNDQAEEAANFYASVFDDCKVIDVMRAGSKVMSATFVVHGQEIIAFNGGPHYKLTPAVSLFVRCTTQEDVDRYWEKLVEGGGRHDRCGWLTDRFGLSWQIIPVQLGQLMQNPDREKAGRVMQAMMKMNKIDIAELERASKGDVA